MTGPVHELLTRSARDHPDKTALVHGGRCACYEDLHTLSNRFANTLLRAGLEKGDRVIIVMENSIEQVAAYYGVLKAGLVCVEIHDRSTAAEASYCVENSGARACIAGKSQAARLADIDVEVMVSPGDVVGRPGRQEIAFSDVMLTPEDMPRTAVDENDTACIVYTSGSTGRPKGVMLSHANICSNTESIVDYLGLTPEDRVMAVLPFHYVYGKSLLNTHVCVGASVVINNRFAFPNAVIKEMVEIGVTGFAGVPSTFAILMNRSIFPRTPVPTLRYVTQAGGAMAPALTKRLVERLGTTQLFVMYGATEATARLTYVPPERLVRDKMGSIGIPIPGVSVSIRDDEGNELGAGVVGNICAQGPNIMQGYWGDDEETARVLRPWGLVTGDLGYKDADGYIYLTGRKKDMLKIGGERVSPKEIEDAIVASGMVHEAAVIGQPDEVLSEVARAYVVPLDESAFDLDALRRFVAEQISPHKNPRSWVVRKTLPKRPSGKIDKEALRHETLHDLRVA